MYLVLVHKLQFPTEVFLLLCPFVKMSDGEDDDKLGNPDGDIENEKLSQTVDNPYDKPGAPRCRLRSGTLIFASRF